MASGVRLASHGEPPHAEERASCMEQNTHRSGSPTDLMRSSVELGSRCELRSAAGCARARRLGAEPPPSAAGASQRQRPASICPLPCPPARPPAPLPACQTGLPVNVEQSSQVLPTSSPCLCPRLGSSGSAPLREPRTPLPVGRWAVLPPRRPPCPALIGAPVAVSSGSISSASPGLATVPAGRRRTWTRPRGQEQLLFPRNERPCTLLGRMCGVGHGDWGAAESGTSENVWATARQVQDSERGGRSWRPGIPGPSPVQSSETAAAAL